MRRLVLCVCCLLFQFIPLAQPIDSTIVQLPRYKPEILTNGFIEYMNTGQMNASARLLRLFIGEPKRYYLPVSLYSGVSSNSYGNLLNPNETFILNVINPLSGVLNVCIDNTNYFGRKTKLSKFGVVYQVGERLLSYTHQLSYKPVSFMNTYANAGFIIQTGAWEKSKIDNMGTFWMTGRALIVGVNNFSRTYFGDSTQRAVLGLSIGMGVEINKVIIIKTFYYKYLNIKNPSFHIPIFQFSFNYSTNR